MTSWTAYRIYYNKKIEHNIAQTRETSKYQRGSYYITTSCETKIVEMLCMLCSKNGCVGNVPYTIESSRYSREPIQYNKPTYTIQ